MSRDTVFPVLKQADEVPLPTLGGMARPNGVVIASERFWAFAKRDGEVVEGSMPNAPRLARSMPLVRGLVRLSASVSPLFRRDGITRKRERLLLTVALLAPCAFVLLSSTASVFAGVVLAGVLLAWLLRGRTLYLHGAEHRAIAAAEHGSLAATWGGEARPSRFSLRCGTNFVALVFPMGILADRLWPFPQALWTPLLLAALTLGVSMELWRAVQSSSRRGARVFLLPGLALQRLTTREPSLDETRLALTAVASVLRRELA